MKLVISEALWHETWAGLASRGQGHRESACVWAGRRTATEDAIDAVIFLDDFAGTRGHRLQHCTPRRATQELFGELQARGLLILADVHTHPGSWVQLSEVDQANPIEYRCGLLALVIPHFAIHPPVLSTVGIHEYLGEGAWRELGAPQIAERFEIRRSQ